jgi:hypothetical protein
MADLPPEMLMSGRHPDQHFADEERRYRRFAPESLDGNEISIAAFALPDMSVMREKYTKDPRWVLIVEECIGWGVLGFLVRDIPPRRELWHEGVIAYVLGPRHVPYQRNYPHSEVWVFLKQDDGKVHICRADKNEHLLNPDFHLRWRECIVLASHVVIPPGEVEKE